jgi:hypothetical protein
MAAQRPSQSHIIAARKAARQAEMHRAIAARRLVVRQMTADEREQSVARRAAAKASAGGPKRESLALRLRTRSERRPRAAPAATTERRLGAALGADVPPPGARRRAGPRARQPRQRGAER